MIRTLRLKFGAAPGQQAVELPIAPVTVFVGPNNSGKSLVLQEINRYCREGISHPSDKVLASLDFDSFPDEEVAAVISASTIPPRPKDRVRADHIRVGTPQSRREVRADIFDRCMREPNAHKENFCKFYLSHYVLMLDGKGRIQLVREQQASDLQEPAQNVLDILFRDDAKRLEVRRILLDAFGTHFVIDPTNLGHFRIRLSAAAPTSEVVEQGFHAEARAFHNAATLISDASDGVKAFAGIITEIVAGDPKIILIDEPEAFLHPALSYKLGKEMAVTARISKKRLFVSTHSANFVMGCIQSGADTNIIRLTYQNGIPTARTLPKDKLLKLMRNPLLRSTGVLQGLFYESVIVTESDSDRAFYQEINERILRSDPSRGVPNALFLNAQNKQTVHQIIRPLRELGIPAAAIVDVDILKDGGKTWTDFLSGGDLPPVSHSGLGQLRSQLKKKCEDTGKNMKKDGGIEILDPEDKNGASDLFDQLDSYGLFVVRKGELESWLPHLSVAGHGPEWLVDVFEKMGENPDAAGYVTSGEGDVWEFIESIGKWLKDPNRKGIPTETQIVNAE